MFKYLKNIPIEDNSNNNGLNHFNKMLSEFKSSYKLAERKIVLSENEKLKLIEAQRNASNISGAPIFLGDDIEVDHEFPIAKGGKDEIENLKIVHKDENREKGSKI
jgi:5-methylcytosine-specific restriction endonuclease McrA